MEESLYSVFATVGGLYLLWLASFGRAHTDPTRLEGHVVINVFDGLDKILPARWRPVPYALLGVFMLWAGFDIAVGS